MGTYAIVAPELAEYHKIDRRTIPASQSTNRLQFYGNNAKFLDSLEHQLVLSGPAECVAGETLIYDPLRDCSDKIEEIYRDGHAPTVLTLSGSAQADVPFIKGRAALYRIVLASGKSCLVTVRHRVLSQSGWRFVSDLYVGDAVLSSDANRLRSSSDACPSKSDVDVQRWTGKVQGYQAHYSSGCHLYDVALLQGSAAGLTSRPSLSGALGYTHDYQRQDAPCLVGLERSRLYQSSDRPSSAGYVPYLYAERKPCAEYHVALRSDERYDGWSQFEPQSQQSTDLQSPSFVQDQYFDSKLRWSRRSELYPHDEAPLTLSDRKHGREQPLSWRSKFPDTRQESECAVLEPDVYSLSLKLYYTAQWDEITSIEYEKTDNFYDLHVPNAEHYLADGIWHHNTGKTYTCCEKLHRTCLANKNVQAAIIRKTYQSMPGSVLQTFAQIAGSSAVPFGGAKPQWYDYPNGSRVWIGGMDHPDKVLSSERDFIYINQAEELSLSDWETLRTRATGRAGHVPRPQVIGDCNPSTPTHWIKAMAIPMIESRHEDNPTLFNQETGEITEQGKLSLSILDQLTGPRKARLRYGQWAGAEGMIYEDSWDAKHNLIDAFEIPADWRRYISIDFGFTNPFVAQWWAEDPDGRLYLYREIYHTQVLVEDHARKVKELTTERIEAVICDHDAEGRETFTKHAGMDTIGAKKEVLEGIQAVASRLRKNGDNKPRLFLMRDARIERDSSLAEKHKPTCTAEEVEGYVWKESKTPGKKEEPLKENDHGMDAMRYLVMHRESPSGWSDFY